MNTSCHSLQKTNCLTEIWIKDALERAAELDASLQKNGKVVGPLHGLPISLKDQFCLKGHEATMGKSIIDCSPRVNNDRVHDSLGYVALIGKPAEDDSAIVKLLIQNGAVLYVKTNVPQTLMVRTSSEFLDGLITSISVIVGRNFEQRLWAHCKSTQQKLYLRRVFGR